jgi:hypothetical protein
MLLSQRFACECHLTLEGHAHSDFVASFIEFLGVERSANAKGEALVYFGVVRKRCNALIINFGLCVSVSGCATVQDQLNLPLRKKEGRLCISQQTQCLR